jgi:ribosome maturation factor RimP
MAKKKINTVQACAELAQPVADRMGLTLWDVRFEKEGGTWMLRYLVDKEGGVTIQDLEQFSRAVDPLLDAADPIEQSYCLEVSSPGIERELVRPQQFSAEPWQGGDYGLIREQDGRREITGMLLSYEDGQIAVRETTVRFFRRQRRRRRLSPAGQSPAPLPRVRTQRRRRTMINGDFLKHSNAGKRKGNPRSVYGRKNKNAISIAVKRDARRRGQYCGNRPRDRPLFCGGAQNRRRGSLKTHDGNQRSAGAEHQKRREAGYPGDRA